MDSVLKFLKEVRETPPPPFIIDQLLPDSWQSYMLLCGRPGIGKTNLALYLAFCLARGDPFFDFKTKPTKTGYLFMEGGKHQIADRVVKLAKNYAQLPPTLYIQPLEPTSLTPQGKDNLLQVIHGVKVVIIDPLKFLTPGDYMKPNDVKLTLTTLLELQNRFHFISILIGHIRKPDRAKIEDPDDYWTDLKGPTEYLEMANSAILLRKPRHAKNPLDGTFTSNINARELCFIKARDAQKDLHPIKLLFNPDLLLYRPYTDHFGGEE